MLCILEDGAVSSVAVMHVVGILPPLAGRKSRRDHYCENLHCLVLIENVGEFRR